MPTYTVYNDSYNKLYLNIPIDDDNANNTDNDHNSGNDNDNINIPTIPTINPAARQQMMTFHKICTTKTKIFILNTKNDLYFNNENDNYLLLMETPSINLILLKNNIIDIELYNEKLYIVDGNGQVFYQNIKTVMNPMNWIEIPINSYSKKCIIHDCYDQQQHPLSPPSVMDQKKIPIMKINCNNNGILFTTFNHELYGMGNFGDVLHSDSVPCRIECFIGFKILQITTGDHFVCVLTHTKPQSSQNKNTRNDDEEFNNNNNNDRNHAVDNVTIMECPKCISNDKNSPTNLSIASSSNLSISDQLLFDNNTGIGNPESAITIATTCLNSMELQSQSNDNLIIEAATNIVNLKNNVTNITNRVYESVKTLSKQMNNDSDKKSSDIDLSINVTSKHHPGGKDLRNKENLNGINTSINNISIMTDTISEYGGGFSSYCDDSVSINEDNLSLDDFETYSHIEFDTIGHQHNNNNNNNNIGIVNKLNDEYNTILKLSQNGANLIGTNVWCFGSVNKGQLGTGDHIKRSHIISVLGLTGKGVIKIASGQEHSVALTLDGRLFLWGNNSNGQISSEIISDVSAPRLYNGTRMEQHIFDVCCGSNSTFILLQNTLEIKKLKNEPPDKENRFEENIQYVLKNPLSSTSSSSTSFVEFPFINEHHHYNKILLSSENDNFLYVHQNVNNNLLEKFTTIEKFLTSEQKYLQELLHSHGMYVKPLLKKLHYIQDMVLRELIDKLCTEYLCIINVTALNVKSTLDYIRMIEQQQQQQPNDMNIKKICFIQNSIEYISCYCKYIKLYCDILCMQGFNSLAAIVFDKPKDLKIIFLLPLKRTWDYITILIDLLALLSQRGESIAAPTNVNKNVKQQNFYNHQNADKKLVQTDLNYLKQLIEEKRTQWERFRNHKDLAIDSAERTCQFWESPLGKIVKFKLQIPERRLILHSKELPLKLTQSGRFSTHWFILFSDYFCHITNSNTITMYPLKLIWLQLVSDKPIQHNGIKIITPEEVFNVQTQSHEEKLQWVDAIENGIRRMTATALNGCNDVDDGSWMIDDGKWKNGISKIPQCRRAEYTFSAKHLKYSNCKYVGKWFMGKMHGIGHLEYLYGKLYDGNMLYGEITGFGRMFTPAIGIYEGEFYNGNYHGFGILEWQNGTICYEGNFKNGQYSGHGILRTDQFTYIGEFLNNIKNGYGVLDDLMNGEKYMGQFHDNRKNGCGITIAMDGRYFEGVFTNDQLAGDGIAILENGTYFEGELNVHGPIGRGQLRIPMVQVSKDNHQSMIGNEYSNIEMNGNILHGQLSGTWNDIKIVNGTFSMNQHFPKLPKTLGMLSIEHNRKWCILFSDWELDVFANDNPIRIATTTTTTTTQSTSNSTIINHLTHSQIWNKIAIFITKHKQKEKFKNNEFNATNNNNGKDKEDNIQNTIDYRNRLDLFSYNLNNSKQNLNIHNNNNNNNNKWVSLDRISLNNNHSTNNIQNMEYSIRHCSSTLNNNNNKTNNINSMINEKLTSEAAAAAAAAPPPSSSSSTSLSLYDNKNHNHLYKNQNHHQKSISNELLYDNMKNGDINLADFFKYKKDVSSTWMLNNINSNTNTSNNNNNIIQQRESTHLEYIPTFCIQRLTSDELLLLKEYLHDAFLNVHHPLNVLYNRTSCCFYSTYGCWKVKPTIVLTNPAIMEWESLTKRIYAYIRKMFPALPMDSDCIDGELISFRTLLYPVLLSECVYSTLLVLYANKCCEKDELYSQRIKICDRKTNEELCRFLKIDKFLVEFIESKEFQMAVDCLKGIQEQYCPREMLRQIENTFNLIDAVRNDADEDNRFMINADNIMPITIMLVIRANIPHLGAELLLLEDLLGNDFQSLMIGYGGYCFTTLKATYHHLLNEKFFHDF